MGELTLQSRGAATRFDFAVTSHRLFLHVSQAELPQPRYVVSSSTPSIAYAVLRKASHVARAKWLFLYSTSILVISYSEGLAALLLSPLPVFPGSLEIFQLQLPGTHRDLFVVA
mmetsp:Transcript_12680/g.16344  ORF Transcript_12680/g.16344 Transcript_12680/m.16344 type:complete len:114 (-) Transcript_12680:419-760(-)